LVGQAFLAWPEGELHKKLESFEVGTAKRVRAFLLGRYHVPYLPRLLDSDVDVDRADFLQRDSQQCGVTYGGYDLARLVSTCTVGETDEKELVVGFGQPKSVRAVEQFLIARRAMYEAVYRHKTVCSAEGMVALFLKRLRPVAQQGQLKGLADRIVGPLMKMVAGEVVGPRDLLSTDDFALQVLIDVVAHATGIDPTVVDLANRILSRDLFKMVPRQSEKLADFLQSPEAYPRIDAVLRERGFAHPEFYRITDKVPFNMLAERKEERGYFVDADGRATEMREHENIRPIRGHKHDSVRLFVPEEAVGAVANLIK
jgi:HD superfamily phosphohydrolase